MKHTKKISKKENKNINNTFFYKEGYVPLTSGLKEKIKSRREQIKRRARAKSSDGLCCGVGFSL